MLHSSVLSAGGQKDIALPSITRRNVQDATTSTSVIGETSPIGYQIAQRPSQPGVGERLLRKRPSTPVRPKVLACFLGGYDPVQSVYLVGGFSKGF